MADNIDLEQFKEYVKNFIEIDNTLKESQKELSTLRKEKTALNKKILAYMRDHDVETCNIPGGKLHRRISKSTTGFKKDLFQSRMMDYFTKNPSLEGTPQEKAEKLINYYMETRETVERETLRRTKTKE